jgi:hypothetical protein
LRGGQAAATPAASVDDADAAAEDDEARAISSGRDLLSDKASPDEGPLLLLVV